jgi:hypothetical protein
MTALSLSTIGSDLLLEYLLIITSYLYAYIIGDGSEIWTQDIPYRLLKDIKLALVAGLAKTRVKNTHKSFVGVANLSEGLW